MPAAEKPVGQNGEDADERNEEGGQHYVIPGVGNVARVRTAADSKVIKSKEQYDADKSGDNRLELPEQDATQEEEGLT